MMREVQLGLGVLLWALAPVVSASAQWSNDPEVNLPIATRGGEQNQPKIRATSDGGCYVSWYDDCFDGHDVYLQRLDARGCKQWPCNGRLVADRGLNWFDDYGLCVDDDDNALLAFRDQSGGKDLIRVVKVNQDGGLPWGPEAAVVYSGTDGAFSARVTATSDGHCVVAWATVVGRSGQARLWLQRLDADGSALCGPGLMLADPDNGSFLPCDVKASDDGSVIVSWVRQGPPSTCDPNHLWAQKFSAAGAAQWRAGHLVVFDGGSLQFGEFPTFVADGAGGAVFGWRFLIFGTSDCAVQRILTDGSEWLPHNGITPSIAPRPRYEPSVAFNATTQDILVFWEEGLLGPHGSRFAVFGQKVRHDRGREWTAEGRMVTPFGPIGRGPIQSLPCGDGAMVFFADGPGVASQLYGARLDTKGGFVWTPEIVLTGASYAYRLDGALSNRGMALLAWVDGRRGDMDIFAQSVQPSGTLGPGPVAPGGLVIGGAD